MGGPLVRTGRSKAHAATPPPGAAFAAGSLRGTKDPMNRPVCFIAFALASMTASAADVGVSVNVNVPGVYGRIDLGGYPPPQVVYPQPVYVQRDPGRAPPPIYLRVPPGHQKNWRKHCREYDACGQPVYFVQENWYRSVYEPRYRERERGGGGRDERRGDDRGDRRDDRGDRRDDRRDDDRHDNGRPGDRPGEGRGRGNR